MQFQLIKTIELHDLAKQLGWDIEDSAPCLSITNVAAFSDVTEGSLVFTTENFNVSAETLCVIICPRSRTSIDEFSLIRTEHPRLEFIRALQFFDSLGILPKTASGHISSRAIIDPSAVVMEGVVIGARTYVGPNAVIRGCVTIGNDCYIGSGAVIGDDGFGFERDAQGIPLKFVHLGGVQIGNGVSVGSNSAIARGALSDTIISDFVKIDNLVHISHNCVIGRGSMIAAAAEISGSVVIEESVWIGPNCSVREGVQIGIGAHLGIAAVVLKDVPAGAVIVGNPGKVLRIEETVNP
jgi:UDP-3-O-[3-hydroxymyristoyl] glucosamine N-acyltransferase